MKTYIKHSSFSLHLHSSALHLKPLQTRTPEYDQWMAPNLLCSDVLTATQKSPEASGNLKKSCNELQRLLMVCPGVGATAAESPSASAPSLLTTSALALWIPPALCRSTSYVEDIHQQTPLICCSLLGACPWLCWQSG
ncbi:unnamed protein product [Pleuronectes platessa]|uniref:Uncharacterized protein n=1 Tax=Pleuronectes platessa TaxID=8262 RepID=A0A9N7U3B0_PLEPL|nr:unnamed protein product [Pleuronectes platessa]